MKLLPRFSGCLSNIQFACIDLPYIAHAHMHIAKFKNSNVLELSSLPNLYSTDFHWRIAWLYTVKWLRSAGISQLVCVRANCKTVHYSVRANWWCSARVHADVPCNYMRMHGVYLANGSMNSEKFEDFIRTTLLPILRPFNWINSNSVVLMDYASIRHVEGVTTWRTKQVLSFLPSSGLSRSQSLWRHL